MFKNQYYLRNFIFFPFLFLLMVVSDPHLAQPRYSHLKGILERNVKKGESLKKIGEFSRAIKVYKEAVRIARRSREYSAEVNSLIKVGVISWNLGKMDDSYDWLNKALHLAREHGFKREIQECLDFLRVHRLYKEGKSYRNKYMYKESIEKFREAIGIARKIGSKEHELKCLRQLGVSYYRNTDLDKFYEMSQRALAISRVLNHKLEEGRCLNNIGLYY
ncbi:MAG: hypothetical protein ACE5LC_06735, partial [Candidatus Aminicenantales bacterium]